MFDDDDPYLASVRAVALEFPDADEKVSHGRPAFFTRKVFAYYGGSLKVDGEYVQHPHSIVVKPDSSERQALLDDDRVYLPAYLAPSGWIGLDLEHTGDWSEIAELLDASFRLTAPKRAIAALDTDPSAGAPRRAIPVDPNMPGVEKGTGDQPGVGCPDDL